MNGEALEHYIEHAFKRKSAVHDYNTEYLQGLLDSLIIRILSSTTRSSSMPKHLILVAGNIGSGKTSLTERIGERLGWRTAYESVTDNPYLADFYGDMKQWSFHLQVFFLGHRGEQHLEMFNDSRSAIIDRSIYEDAFIFVRALHSMGISPSVIINLLADL
jgi:hypothetical protein